jgi:hypothetical protein
MTTSPESNGLWMLKLSTILHSTGQHLVKNFLSKHEFKLLMMHILKQTLFLSRRILQMTGEVTNMGEIHWELTICLLIAWVLLYVTIRKSVRWSGTVLKVARSLNFLNLTARINCIISRQSGLRDSYPSVLPVIGSNWSSFNSRRS